MLKCFFIGCVSILFLGKIGQTQPLSDTIFVRRAYINTIELYENTVKANNGLYNGRSYVWKDYTDIQHPFYKINDWQEGDVIYNGQSYHKVNFLYDLVNDWLITEVSGQPIVLVKDKLSKFSIGDKEFIHLTDTAKRNLQSGIYEVNYAGPSQILIKHIKDYAEKVADGKILVLFHSKDYFYVLHGGTYLPFRRKNTFLNIFSDKKSELKAYINSHHIVISKKDSRGFAILAAYYDSLTGSK
jgi:hypothetical protein